MRTRTYVLIGIGLTVFSSLFLSLAQIYAMYKFQIYAGMGWLQFIQEHAWHPWNRGFHIWCTLNGIPDDLYHGVIIWFLFLLPAVGLFIVFHPFKKPQRVLLAVLVMLTIIDLCRLLLGWGVDINAPEEHHVACFLHLGLSVLSIIGAIPLRLAVREELGRTKEEERE